MKGRTNIFLPLLFSLLLLSLSSCASSSPKTILLRDPQSLPEVVHQTFAQEGKSDYVLLNDDGYSFRLIYLCENRILNFLSEPENNPVFVSIQPLLDSPVESKLSSEDRTRIWLCIERKARAEEKLVSDLRRKVSEENERLEREISAARSEREKILADIEWKRKEKEIAGRQRRLQMETRLAEEERLRKTNEEEQRRKGEEERKIRIYKAGAKEKEREDAPQPSPMVKATESGVFLALREIRIFEEARDNSKAFGTLKANDIIDIINSKKDSSGLEWYQFLTGERVTADKGRRIGWTPEERSFWTKNKLLIWVYPGDFSKITIAKPSKLNLDAVQYTGKKTLSPQKMLWYEVSYDVNFESSERVYGWVNEKNGIRRRDMNREEMTHTLKSLARNLWPPSVQNDILKGYIRMGFTPEQVILSWGNPNHVNTTRTLVGVYEQWVYGEKPFPNAYVYFENGQVKSWEFLKKNGS